MIFFVNNLWPFDQEWHSQFSVFIFSVVAILILKILYRLLQRSPNPFCRWVWANLPCYKIRWYHDIMVHHSINTTQGALNPVIYRFLQFVVLNWGIFLVQIYNLGNWFVFTYLHFGILQREYLNWKYTWSMFIFAFFVGGCWKIHICANISKRICVFWMFYRVGVIVWGCSKYM